MSREQNANVAELSAKRAERRQLTIYDEGDDHPKKVDALDLARSKLRLPTLRRVVKRAQRDALYDLELEDGTLIPLGSISQLKDPRKVEDAVAEQIGDLPPRYSQAKFRDVARALLRIAELEDSGTSPTEVTCGWLADYVGERVIDVDLDDPETRSAVVGHGDPFCAGGCLYVHLPDFERFIRTARRIPINTRELGARLARLGFEDAQLAEPRAGRETRKRRRYWRSPVDFDPSGRA